MTKLIIVADIIAKPDKIDLVRKELEKLIPPTRAEVGCVKYDLHLDNKDPAHFLFYEIWDSYDLWQDHMKTPHIEQNGKATEGAIADLKIYEMTHIA